MKRHILTGTPSAGKTTLLHALAALGYPTVSEAATDVIAASRAKGTAEFWRDPVFIDEIIALQRQRRMNASSQNDAIQFHDRSPVCTYALGTYLRFEPSVLLLEEMARLKRGHVFEKRVFFIENLGFVKPTEARKITFEEALIFEEIHRETYRAFGYECVSIAPGSVSERVQQILSLV